nr:recombinase family protein [uncultured Hyphomonas sp.]
MTVYGYARVSTQDQHLDLQLDALRKAGCERVFQDHGVGGVSDKRVELYAALQMVQPGDVFVVWRLDRMARSMIELVNIVVDLHERGVAFRSLCEYIDVNSAFGELVLHILSAIAHFERALIVERTRAGMQAAKERGVHVGRPRALDGEDISKALLLLNGGMSVPEAANELGIGTSTLYRYVAAA